VLALLDLPWIFPVVFQLWGVKIPAHLVFDLLAYSGGFRLYLWQRKKHPGPLAEEPQAWLMLGCVVGALIGAKFLSWTEHAAFFWTESRAGHYVDLWLGGKTIIGGLLGAWLGIEIVKKACGIRHSTGDAFVFPLLCGIAIGRVGCFLTGLPDFTCGSPSSLPWAVDFGDGIGRHPAQLYEIFYLGGLAVFLPKIGRSFPRSGSHFRLFIVGYLGFRFFSEFYKQRGDLYFYFSALQWACILGSSAALASLLTQKPTHR
jgi:phosphatidylglycerol---prolipoprotein diacylglyceryl transferase